MACTVFMLDELYTLLALKINNGGITFAALRTFPDKSDMFMANICDETKSRYF